MAFDTTDYTSQRFFPASVEDKLVAALGRAAGVVLLAVVAFVWLSLASWTTRDPSLTLAISGPVQNFAGAPGAIISDLILQMLGFASAIALLAPMIWGVELVHARQVVGFRAKVAFYPLSVLIFAGALSALPVAQGWPLVHGYGGILGDFVFGLVAGVFSALNPARASVATGVLLTAIGMSTLMHSLGLELRDLHRILFQPMRNMNWRERADSWQQTLLSEAKRVRDNVRETFESDQPDGMRSASVDLNHTEKPTPGLELGGQDQSQPAWSRDIEPAPNNILTEDRQTKSVANRLSAQPSPQTPAQANPKGIARSTWLKPIPPNPIGAPTSNARHASTHSASTPAVAQNGELQPHIPATTPRPISNPFDTRSAATSDTSPGQGQVSANIAPPLGAPAGTPTVAEQFAAHVAENPGGPDDADDDAQSSREMARRFAPAFARLDQQELPVSNDNAVAAATGTVLPSLMQAKSSGPAKRRYCLPSTKLLSRPEPLQASAEQDPQVLHHKAEELQTVLADFGVMGAVKNIRPGPVVTLYEFEPARGIKSSRVIALADDIARSMSAVSARVAVVPGRNAIGIELPNAERRSVLLRELLDSNAYRGSGAALPLTLGKSIGGEAVVADLARMPHLLVAGTTGSGKSVGVNSMVLSILFKHAPETCRLLMIDPKMLELSVYNDIPHLLSPVITDPQKAVVALNWAVREMEERYKKMSKLSVRNIGVYNNRVRNAKKRGESLARTVHTGFDASGQAIYENENMQLEELPHIVIVVDEFADLMLVAGKELEAAIQRLAQMARAAGIHLIMATQRPSVDVITGTIKANFPTRISFKVTSKVDSRTILNEQGAEQLLGQGDMLYASGDGQTLRVHGPFVSDEEVESIAAHLKAQGAPAYVADVTKADETAPATGSSKHEASENLYDQAIALVLRDRKASTSYVQRRLSIGYNRAADLIERMEQDGVISAAGTGGKREILLSAQGAQDAGSAA